MLARSSTGESFSELTTFSQVRMLEHELKSVQMQNMELGKKNIKLEVQYDTLRYVLNIIIIM
jgi:hypothetical protein